jgi:hypothetical protein
MASIINASSTGSGGIVQTADASGVLQLQTNGTVALTVDTSANVGIGATATGRFLSYTSGGIHTFQGAYGASGTFQAGTGTLTLGGGSSPRGIGVLINANRSVNTTLTYGNNFETFGLLSIANVGTGGGYGTTGVAGYAESDGYAYGLRADAKTTAAGGASPAAGLYIGSVTGSSTNYGIYVSDTTLSNYMGSITFPATQAASANANTLDDYEEGTWTPSWSGGLTDINYGTVRNGYYRKIGSVVHIWFGIMTNGLTVTASGLSLSGLPFTAASGAGSNGAVNVWNVTRWTSSPPIVGQVELSSTLINFYNSIGATGAGTDPVLVTTGNMATGSGNRNLVFASATYSV